MKKKQKTISIAILLLVILGYFFIVRPFLKIKTAANGVMAEAKQLKEAFSKNDIDLLNNKLEIFAGNYSRLEKEAKSVYWLSFIPYFADLKNGVEAGGYLVKAGKETIKTIAPYADLIGFKKGQASFVERSSEDRLQTAILTLDKVLSNIDIISENINQAEIRVAKINPNRYPEKIGKTVIRSRLINIKEQFVGLASLFVDAKPLVKRLPEIFGTKKEQTYLLLFQNDKERRATGGFLTAYAVFKVRNGKLTIEKSDDIYSLDNSISPHPKAPKEILTYHKGVYEFYIRDSNLSPDLPTSVEIFNSLYKLSSAKVNYDGIIMLDSKVLVDMLTIFGDTEAGGVRFSSKIDSRCDCPQVLYQLFDMVDRPVPYERTDRKGILGELMYALFYKALGFSPSKYWGTLAQQMFKNLQEKHILLYFTDKDLQTAAEKLNFAGSIKKYDGDYLHVNNVNFAGAKANLFVSETITSKTKTAANKITRELTIDYRNPYPHSDCNLERGGLCLNAPLRNWVRAYVPQGSKLISFEGSIKPVQTYDDLGKTVFEGFLMVNPLGKATVNIKYELPSSLVGKDYKLLIQKQPGVDDQKIKVDYNGKILYDGLFTVDKELKNK